LLVTDPLLLRSKEDSGMMEGCKNAALVSDRDNRNSIIQIF